MTDQLRGRKIGLSHTLTLVLTLSLPLSEALAIALAIQSNKIQSVSAYVRNPLRGALKANLGLLGKDGG